jgi:protein phosphatase
MGAVQVYKFTGTGVFSKSDTLSFSLSFNMAVADKVHKFLMFTLGDQRNLYTGLSDFLNFVYLYITGSVRGLLENSKQGYVAILRDPSTHSYRIVTLPSDKKVYSFRNNRISEVAAGETLDDRILFLSDKIDEKFIAKGYSRDLVRDLYNVSEAMALGFFKASTIPHVHHSGVAVALLSDVGLKRQNNEDAGFTLSLKISSRGQTRIVRLVGVADGAGGLSFGELASREAVFEFLRTSLPQIIGGAEPRAILSSGIMKANEKVLSLARSYGKNMASTFSVALIDGSDIYVGHVGDSRVYFISGSQIIRLTTDHKPRDGPRNVITNALGLETMWVELHGKEAGLKLVPGSTIISATDGLTDLVSEREIHAYTQRYRGTPNRLAWELVELAKKRGGHDNITISIVSRQN